MREAAEGRPIIDHLKAPRRGAAKRSGAGGRTHRGQTTKPNGATHRPGGGQVPGSMPGCSKPDGGGARGTERQRNRHRRPPTQGGTGAKSPRTKTEHRSFPTGSTQKAHEKSEFLYRFCTVYKAFRSVLRGFYKGCIPTHTTRKPLIYKALRRFDAYDNRSPTAEAELTV